MLSNKTVPGQHDVKLAVRIVNHLDLVEDKVTERTIRKIYLSHVCVPSNLVIVVVDLVLLFTSKLAIDWNMIQLLLLLKDFFDSLLLRLLKECGSIIAEIVDEIRPLKGWCD